MPPALRRLPPSPGTQNAIFLETSLTGHHAILPCTIEIGVCFKSSQRDQTLFEGRDGPDTVTAPTVPQRASLGTCLFTESRCTGEHRPCSLSGPKVLPLPALCSHEHPGSLPAPSWNAVVTTGQALPGQERRHGRGLRAAMSRSRPVAACWPWWCPCL